MIQKYPFVVIFYKSKVYGYFPDIKKIVIESELVSTCLFCAKKKLEEEMEKYKNTNKQFPISNHLYYYIKNEKYDYPVYVTYISISI